MVNWHEYNEQSYKCRQLASQAFIGNLMAYTNAKKVYRLPHFLKQLIDDHNFINKKARQKYFYKKYNGELIKKRKSVESFDKAIPHISDILSHPLLTLLSTSIFTYSELLDIAKKLPFTVQSHILNREGDTFIYRDNLLKFLNMNTYDALTATLLVLLAHPEHLNIKEKFDISSALFRFIIRFITPKNAKLAANLNSRFIQLLALSINDEQQTICTFNMNDKEWSLPIYLTPSFDHEAFQKFLDIYDVLCQRIINTGTIHNDNSSFENVMKYVNHEELSYLAQKLEGKLPKPHHRTQCPLHQINIRLSGDTAMDSFASISEAPQYIHSYRY
ncbi:MAG: hypothetical protein ACI87J_001259 [Colwellia sp.]|jgi:hypothetical protein